MLPRDKGNGPLINQRKRTGNPTKEFPISSLPQILCFTTLRAILTGEDQYFLLFLSDIRDLAEFSPFSTVGLIFPRTSFVSLTRYSGQTRECNGQSLCDLNKKK